MLGLGLTGTSLPRTRCSFTTDSGLKGCGEAFGFLAVACAKLAIDGLISPFCIGREATQIGSLMVEVQKRLHVFMLPAIHATAALGRADSMIEWRSCDLDAPM